MHARRLSQLDRLDRISDKLYIHVDMDVLDAYSGAHDVDGEGAIPPIGNRDDAGVHKCFATIRYPRARRRVTVTDRTPWVRQIGTHRAGFAARTQATNPSESATQPSRVWMDSSDAS